MLDARVAVEAVAETAVAERIAVATAARPRARRRHRVAAVHRAVLTTTSGDTTTTRNTITSGDTTSDVGRKVPKASKDHREKLALKVKLARPEPKGRRVPMVSREFKEQ